MKTVRNYEAEKVDLIEIKSANYKGDYASGMFINDCTHRLAGFKPSFITIFFLFNALMINCQVISGNYDSDMKIAYNPANKLITGYYENHTGYDEATKEPRFSCVFYIYGICNGALSEIETYYPGDKGSDVIKGTLRVNDSTNISIKLSEEHGGCWNVNHFADGFADFKLSKKTEWVEIRYIETEKSFFYKNKNDESKQNTYLVKGDIIYIDKTEGAWVHCKYYGKTNTEGWMKRENISK